MDKNKLASVLNNILDKISKAQPNDAKVWAETLEILYNIHSHKPLEFTWDK